MLATRGDQVDARCIIRDGTYYILDDFALRDETHAKVVKAFLDGVEQFEGAACRERVAADGLGQIHRHVPVEKIHLLEHFLVRRLRDDLYYWSYRVGRDTLGLDHPFYLDHLIMMRVHYPFLVARGAKAVLDRPYPLSERLRLAAASLRNWRMLRNYIGRLQANRRAKRDRTASFDPVSYHGQLPVPAHSHGPHVDTWYGHSYDGINLWWSIDGVNEDNTVILYPEMFGRPVTYDPRSMYLAPGIPLPRPHKIALAPKQLLVFNPETLHGTQVNISDETRIAITTRLNPATPRFNSNAPFNFEYWYSSRDLERRKFSKMSVFPAKQYHGEPSVIERPALIDRTTVRTERAVRLSRDTPVAVCAGADLGQGVKLAVNLENAKILLWRNGSGVQAFSCVCPHLGIDVVDGHHDAAEQTVYCPGHGVEYSLKDGTSRCPAFKLRQYRAYEDGGQIYVQVE